jgi:hypothetical protein
MLLRHVDVDGLRRMQTVPDVRPTGVTLGAAIELICGAVSASRTGDDKLRGAATRWFGSIPTFAHALAWIGEGQRPPISHPTSSPVADVWAIEDEDDVTDKEWTLFQDRFRRSAAAHGFSSQLGAALSLAMREMGDNIFQHAGGARGVVAFQLCRRAAFWSVADLGRGALARLRDNPRWASLESAEAALTAIWRDHASSRETGGGSGFRQVDRSIASLNGFLRFRSGDGVLELSGESGRLQSTVRSSPPMSGFQLSICCGMGGPAGDQPLTC